MFSDTPTSNTANHNELSQSTMTVYKRIAYLRDWLANLFTFGKKKVAKNTSTVYTQTDNHNIHTAPSEPSSVDSNSNIEKTTSMQSFQTASYSPTAPTEIHKKVNTYVDNWYNANRDEIDIGRIDLPLVGEVDVFPDKREKALYRKIFMLALTNLLEMEIQIAGVPMRLSVIQEPVKDSKPDAPD